MHSPNLARLKSSVKVIRHIVGLWKAVVGCGKKGAGLCGASFAPRVIDGLKLEVCHFVGGQWNMKG